MRQNLSGFVFLFYTVLVWSACKKEETSGPLTIPFYDKSLVEVQTALAGDWRLVYSQGGICGACISLPPADYVVWHINSNGTRIVETTKGTVSLDTTISWKRVKASYYSYANHGKSGDSVYMMSYASERCAIDGIFNDTLVTNDYMVADGQTHFWVRKH